MQTFYLPLLLFMSIMVGTQATITPTNLPEIRVLNPYSLQLNNLRIYEDWESFRQSAMLVADMRPMIILYFRPDNSNDYLRSFCEWAAINIPADTFQVAQEPDILDGMYGYYGGWGIENVGRFVEQFNICSSELHEHSEALVSIGVSTCGDWRGWLQTFVNSDIQHLDAIGIHHYNRYHWYEYNPDDLQANIDFVQSFGREVWVSEMGYRCLNCYGDMNDFYAKQAEFVEKAIPDAFAFGAHRVYYYGYNPSWDNVDLKNNPSALKAFTDLTK